MAEAKDRLAWNRTFALLAQTYNINRDPKQTKPVDPMTFFPWSRNDTPNAKRKTPPLSDMDRADLQRAYPRRKKAT